MTAQIVRAAVYARVSRPDEADILTNQIRGARNYCERHGFELTEDHVFQEVASGGKSNRPALNGVLEVAERGKVDLVVFTSLSRVTRGGIEAAMYVLGRLERAKVGWHFVEQPILNFDSTTPQLAKDIMLAVMAAVDKDYRARISVHTKAAFQRRKNLAVARGEPLKWGRPRKRVPPGALGEPVESGTLGKSPRFPEPRGNQNPARTTVSPSLGEDRGI
jgi:DNA invertase Pin-like site-specific DNA recombinase